MVHVVPVGEVDPEGPHRAFHPQPDAVAQHRIEIAKAVGGAAWATVLQPTRREARA